MVNRTDGASSAASNLTADYLPRPRIDGIFDQATGCRLVYVIAGTGYGKTQAVHHYVEQQEGAIVRWMQLTESDNIGSRYWENLTHAVSADNPELAARLRELGFPDTLARFKQFGEAIKEMEHPSLKTFLVLDDFNLIHSEEALTFAQRCANLRIPGACVILISRTEPQINAVSLFSRGKAAIVTEDDLRFTQPEIAEFFTQSAIPFSPSDIERYREATGGWALAVKLLSLVLKRAPKDTNHALNTMRSNIFKLFETEAWEGLPEGIQKTMVKLSLLSGMSSVPLLEVSGDARVLESEPQLSSFMWFDSFAGDYRIHPLYLEFLQGKRAVLTAEEEQETYRRAAAFCYGNDLYMDAMLYWAKAHEYERMTRMLLDYPFKLSYDASAYFFDILEGLDVGEAGQEDPNVIFLKNFFTPLLLTGMGRYEEAFERSNAVIREWEQADTPLALVLLYTAYSNLTYIDMYTCTVTHRYGASQYLRKSVEYFKRSSIEPMEMSGAFLNADVRSFACLVGEGAGLEEFGQFLEEVQQTALYIGETPFNVFAGYDELVACECAFFKGELDAARSHAYSAIATAQEYRQHSIVAMAQQYLLRIAVYEGDNALVKDILKSLRAHLDNPDFSNRQLYYELYTGAFYAQIRLPKLVPRWFVMDKKEAASEFRIPPRELIVDVAYCLAAKKYQRALTILANSYPRLPQERFLFGELRLLLLRAVARLQTGDEPGALADFEAAYGMAFAGLFEMSFIELGKDLRLLVAAELQQGKPPIPKDWLRS
ncbi:MAG: hypothetical protein FWD72_00880, partial [Eggerthellaceae bacterium]|nr:hypothetical protein [Eggerthellaceae bacterium]